MKPQGSTEVVNLPLAAARKLAVMNFYGSVDPKYDNSNFLLVLSEMGMNMTKEVLDMAGLRSQAPRDPNWQDFLFGDITHPTTGLEARATTKVATGNNERGIGINTMCFSTGDKTLTGSNEVAVSQEALAGRYNFFDIENIWNIPHPQTIVDRLIDDNEIPLEFMKEVCGNFCDFPSKESPRFDEESTSFPSKEASEPEIPRVFVNTTPETTYAGPRTIPGTPAYEPTQTAAPVPASSLGMPPQEESDALFAARIDAEIAEIAKVDPTVHFVSYLKDSAMILKYVNGKK
jgi:hypothetical protein